MPFPVLVKLSTCCCKEALNLRCWQQSYLPSYPLLSPQIQMPA